MRVRFPRSLPALLLAVVLGLVAAACEEGPEYAELVPRAEETALRFAASLADRNYHRAYLLASEELKAEMSVEQMIHGFERVVPPDWEAFESVEIARTLNDWADRRLGDISWVEMRIPGPVYDEAVTFVVTYEDEQLRIRSLEFGRP